MCPQKACPPLHMLPWSAKPGKRTRTGGAQRDSASAAFTFGLHHPHLISSNVASLHETLFWQQQELGCIHRKTVWKHLTSCLWPQSFSSPGAFLKTIYSEAPGEQPVTTLISRALPWRGMETGCSARADTPENQKTPLVLADLHNHVRQQLSTLS